MRVGAIATVLAAILAACGRPAPAASPTVAIRSETPVSVTVTQPASPTATLNPTGTPTLLPTATDVPTNMPTATPAILEITVETICPADPLVPLGQLGLDASTRLLLYPETSEFFWDEDFSGPYIAAADAPEPRQVAALLNQDYINSRGYQISPNGRWLLFLRRSVGTERNVVWIASSDGLQQWPLDVSALSQKGNWLNDEAVLVYDDTGDRYSGYRSEAGVTYRIINPFTLEGGALPPLPETQVEGAGGQIFLHAGQAYLLYQEDEDFHLFDPQTRTDHRVLDWLTADPAGFLEKVVRLDGEGRATVAIDRAYGFDISAPLSVEQLLAAQTATETVQQVRFPEWLLPVSSGRGISPNTPTTIWHWQAEGAEFALLDYATGRLRDYCNAPGSFWGASPDGRFAAFTRRDLPSTQPVPKTTFILSLETGFMSEIADFEFGGWAKADS